MIRLFTSIFPEASDQRRNEYRKCLERNASCDFIDEICLLSEDAQSPVPVGKNFKIQRIPNRPTYQEYFNWISELATYDDISIIANSDIYFEPSLKVLGAYLKPGQSAALSRWDLAATGEPELFNRNDSQDAWVFRGPLKEIRGDFWVGVPRCDNRMLYELKKVGYEVINPSFSVRACHLHTGKREEYRNENLEDFVEPPYAYLWPHNLWSLPRTMLHNLRHPDARVSWRLDRRKISSSLPVRAVRKVLRSFKLAAGPAN